MLRSRKNLKDCERQLQELFEFKKKKNSVEAIPLEHNYKEEVIDMAKARMGWYKRQKEHIKYIKYDAIEYYKYNEIDIKPYFKDKENEEHINK